MTKVLFFRTEYNYDRDAASNEAAISVFDKGFTQQQFAEEVDINTIVKRFGLTGELPEDFRAPVSGDFSGVSDFHTAMNAVRSAEEAFMSLPGDLRARFVNDPQRLMAFLEDENNRDEASKLGLLRPPPEKDRTDVLIEAVQALKPAEPAK